MGEKSLGSFELATAMAILRLKDNAYGVKIRRELETLLERDIAIGAVYTTLARLEDKGLIASRTGDPTPERGGRAKRYYQLKAAGQAALSFTLAEQERIRRTLPKGALPV